MKMIPYDQYLNIKKALESGAGSETVANLTGVSLPTVYLIKNGKHAWDKKQNRENVAKEEVKAVTAYEPTDIAKKLDIIADVLKENREYMEARDKKLELLFGRLLDGMKELSNKLDIINTTGTRCRAQLEIISEDIKGNRSLL